MPEKPGNRCGTQTYRDTEEAGCKRFITISKKKSHLGDFRLALNIFLYTIFFAVILEKYFRKILKVCKDNLAESDVICWSECFQTQ